MAESPAHKFGQIIGNLIEAVVEPFLSEFAKERRLYLDHQKKFRKARSGKKLAWEDVHGNVHDLDYVLEKDGTDESTGTPVAFIEVAWRRYTKHSRNKAQETQGAILPLAERYQWSNPFLGAILAGVFTKGSLEQMRSLGFKVLYFPYDTLVTAFATEGIDIAFDEKTTDAAFRKCVRQIDSATRHKMDRIKQNLVSANQKELGEFMAALGRRLDRMIQKVIVVPLYGTSDEFATIGDAIRFLDLYRASDSPGCLHKYEVLITFSNGDRVEGSFRDKQKVREFLHLTAMQ